MTFKKFFINCIMSMAGMLVLLGGLTVFADPFFVYHKPSKYMRHDLVNNDEYYCIPGMIRNFDYDAIICGTSMTENFKPTLFDEYFGTKSIKIPIENSGYCETTRALNKAFALKNIRIVLRSLDMTTFFSVHDAKGRVYEYEQTQHLWDDNLLNKHKYLYNKDVLLSKTIPVVQTYNINANYRFDQDMMYEWNDRFYDKRGGYNVMKRAQLINMSLPIANNVQNTSNDGACITSVYDYLSELEIEVISENIQKNFIDLANEHKNTRFVLFLTPYSVLFYGNEKSNGNLERHFAAEKYIIDMLLECNNIEVYSLNLNLEYIANLNNYIDPYHYLGDMNDMILYSIANNENKITKTNLDAYIDEEYKVYNSFDYMCLLEQTAPMQGEFINMYL